MLSRKILIFCAAVFLFLGIFAPYGAFGDQEDPLYFFYGETCPHCQKAEKFLENLKEKYPGLEIKSYEVFGNKENAALLLDFFEEYGAEKTVRVPAFFAAANLMIGYQSDETTGKVIESWIKESLGDRPQKPPDQIVSLPVFGNINLSGIPLPLLAVILGAVDGFNPCAMWVLLFLIALLINTHSRKRMWLIGGTFIAVSGIIYFLLLSAWLNLFLAISYVNLTRILIGVFALGVGVWQIKNFITFKPGVCQVTDGKTRLQDRIKNGLKSQAEKLVFSPFTFAILGGVILLALAVNLVEFFCSAGLPALFTRVLALNQLSTFTYYLYLLLYTFVFMLDDLIIFSLAMITLSRVGFTDKYNYWATLLGGLLMLILGILLIFLPEFLMFG